MVGPHRLEVVRDPGVDQPIMSRDPTLKILALLQKWWALTDLNCGPTDYEAPLASL